MIAALAVGDMFININEIDNTNRDPDFFLHFPMQGRQDRLPMLDLAAGHDPETMKRGDAAAGKKNAIIFIDDTGND